MPRAKLETFVKHIGNRGLVERFKGYRDAQGTPVAHGLVEYIRREVVIERGRCRHGWRHGEWVEFHDNGKIRSISHYTDGHQHGLSRAWHETGTPRFVCRYRNNQLHGRSRTYHENGCLREQAVYKEGVKNGICKVWDENGRLIADGTYRDGLPVDGTCVIDSWPAEEESWQYRDLHEYIECFLNRPIRIARFRRGKEVRKVLRRKTAKRPTRSKKARKPPDRRKM